MSGITLVDGVISGNLDKLDISAGNRWYAFKLFDIASPHFLPSLLVLWCVRIGGIGVFCCKVTG